MKILILGGTVFLGRHLVEAALQKGHEITLFNRGQTNADLFPDIEKLRGDRDGDMTSLARAIQFIDVRDLSEWIIRMAELRKTGVYNATGPQEKLTMQAFIEACSPDKEYIWMEDEFLVEHKVEVFTELPLWIPENDEKWAGFLQVNAAKALQDGLSFRPLSETIQDTLGWSMLRDAPFTKGLNPEKEKQLIEAYRQL